jgi:uncharacterized membrane protein
VSRYAKFITAALAAVGVLAANLLTPETADDVETVLTAVVSILGALGVYAVPNSRARHGEGARRG